MQKKKEKDFYASQSPFLKDPPPPKVLYPFPLATMRGYLCPQDLIPSHRTLLRILFILLIPSKVQ